MPTNNIRRNRHGNKVYNKNATGRRGVYLPDNSFMLSPIPRTHTDPVVRTEFNSGDYDVINSN